MPRTSTRSRSRVRARESGRRLRSVVTATGRCRLTAAAKVIAEYHNKILMPTTYTPWAQYRPGPGPRRAAPNVVVTSTGAGPHRLPPGVAATYRRGRTYRSSGASDVEKNSSSQCSGPWKTAEIDQTELAGVTAIDSRVPVRLLNIAWHRLGWPSAEGLTGCTFAVTHSSHPLILPSRNAAQIITIHDLNFLSHPERTHAEIRRDYPVLIRDHARRANRILVPSRFTAGEVVRLLDVAAEKISVCSPGAPAWTPRPAPPTDGYVLFLGTLEPRKNIGALLDAYERLSLRRYPLPRLVLAGKATGESRPWLERIKRPPLDGAVRHIGYVEPTKRRELYEGARLLVQTSFEEGFGLRYSRR